MHGREPVLPADVALEVQSKLVSSDREYLEHIVESIHTALRIALDNLERSQRRMKEKYDKKSNPRSYNPGDYVWIFSPHLKKDVMRKFAHKFHGPFVILSKMSDVTYKVYNVRENKPTEQVVNVNRMKPYTHPDDILIDIDYVDDKDVESENL
ncbi:uncharacterized protein LOC141910281 [Tubulanus polymorphus]|uniref:uncharacterized protein LOC141910281 n=1 Tax=Tubulanus polymorphus TaxID=672921 RepID=UPI003DA3A432